MSSGTGAPSRAVEGSNLFQSLGRATPLGREEQWVEICCLVGDLSKTAGSASKGLPKLIRFLQGKEQVHKNYTGSLPDWLSLATDTLSQCNCSQAVVILSSGCDL